jgi:hypothetical protein
MGRYAQARRRGSDRADVLSNPAPFLSHGEAETTLQWTWTGADAAFFELQNSLDGETEWEDYDEYGGLERATAELPTGFYYRIAAVFDTPPGVSPWSNVVLVSAP